MTNWPRGGYAAGDTPASELKPPPSSMVSKSTLPATYTAAEVKVLTETASKVAYALGRKDAAEEIAETINRVGYVAGWSIIALDAGRECAKIARRIGSQEPT